MLFWVLVILTIIGIFLTVIEKGRENIIAFCIFLLISSICATTILCMLAEIIKAQTLADASRGKNEERYKALLYKAQAEAIRDEYGIISKEYIDEVQAWNEEVAEYQACSDNFWIGIFFPKKVFEGFETIDLTDIKISD